MDDWQIGDLALCVKHADMMGQKTGAYQNGPIVGSVYTVSGVRDFPEAAYTGDTTGLRISGFTGFLWAGFFRKIHPLSDEEHRECIVELAADQRAPATAQTLRPGHPIKLNVSRFPHSSEVTQS